jgi:hypothetical protein
MKLKELAKTVKTTIRTVGILAKIRSEHLLNTRFERYHIVNCLSVMKIITTNMSVNRMEGKGKEISWKENHNKSMDLLSVATVSSGKRIWPLLFLYFYFHELKLASPVTMPHVKKSDMFSLFFLHHSYNLMSLQ